MKHSIPAIRNPGGKYEIYVTSEDGHFLAGGTTIYRNRKEAERTADSWIEIPGRRAYVVTLEKQP